MNRTRTRPRRIATWSIGTLMVTRFLLIANGLVLLAIGALYLGYGSHPGGLILGAMLVLFAVVLFGCVRFTDPYRHR